MSLSFTVFEAPITERGLDPTVQSRLSAGKHQRDYPKSSANSATRKLAPLDEPGQPVLGNSGFLTRTRWERIKEGDREEQPQVRNQL